MEDKEIQKKAADIILDEPIKVQFDILPQSKIHRIFQRIGIQPKSATYYVKGATLRNMLRISSILTDIEIKEVPEGDKIEWTYNIIKSETVRMAEIIAIAIHNRKSERPQSLVDLIMDNFTATELKGVSNIILDRLNVEDFIRSIASVRTMNILATASPKAKPEIIAEPIVTSGEQLEAFQSIFDGAIQS